MSENTMPPPSFIPERVWAEKVRGKRALSSEARITWMGLRRWLGGQPVPTIDPIVSDRLRVASMALDIADLLKFNDRRANVAILADAMRLLDCDAASDEEPHH